MYMDARTPKLFLLDCETTGLVATSDRILELAVQLYLPGQALNQMQPLSILINPDGVRCSPSARSIHNISDEELIVADYFPAVWARITGYIDAWTDYRTELPVIVAHNAAFDARFLRCELERSHIPLPHNLRLSCSLDLARNLWPGNSAALSKLAKNADVPPTFIKKAHRAAADVKLLACVLNHMDVSISKNTDAGGIESVLHASSVPFASNSMPSSSGISLAPKQAPDNIADPAERDIIRELNDVRKIHSVPKLPLRPADINSPSLATKFFPLSGRNAPAVRLVYAPVRESNADVPDIMPNISGRLIARAPPSSPPEEQVRSTGTGGGRGIRLATNPIYGSTSMSPEDARSLARKLEALTHSDTDSVRTPTKKKSAGTEEGNTRTVSSKVVHTPRRKIGTEEYDDADDDGSEDEIFHTPVGKTDAEAEVTPISRKLPLKSPGSGIGWRRLPSPLDDPAEQNDADDDNDIHFTPKGNCYHYELGCKGLELAKSIKSSPRKWAPGRLRPCKVCSPRAEKVITNEKADYFRTQNGSKYHVRSNCYGLRESKNILGVSEIPKQLEACKVCVLKLNYQYVQ